MREESDLFDIDPNALDDEWIHQSRYYLEAATSLADARYRHEKAKSSLELVVAELDRDVRLHPDKYGVSKITEGTVEKTIILQKPYQKATTEVITAKHTMDIWAAKVHALEHKKSALENMVKLRLNEYYSEPIAPKGKREEVGNMVKNGIRKRGQSSEAK